MIEELKRIANHAGDGKPGSEWAVALQAWIERYGPFVEKAKSFCEWKAKGTWAQDVMSGNAVLEDLRAAHRKAMERP